MKVLLSAHFVIVTLESCIVLRKNKFDVSLILSYDHRNEMNIKGCMIKSLSEAKIITSDNDCNLIVCML